MVVLLVVCILLHFAIRELNIHLYSQGYRFGWRWITLSVIPVAAAFFIILYLLWVYLP